MNQLELIKERLFNRDLTRYFSKTIRFFLLSFLLFTLNSVSFAQSSSVKETKEMCINALKNNTVDLFISTFSDPIEITLPTVENSYSKTQATMVMRDFLQKTQTKSFVIKQSGKSTGGAEFIIGELQTTSGLKYQVYLLITIINSQAYLHLIEFELI